MASEINIIPKRTDPSGTQWPATRSSLAGTFEGFCKVIFKVYCPLSVHGMENLPEPPFMICSNHASHIDSGMLMEATGLSYRRVGLIAAKDYFFDKGHRFYLHYMMNLVPIARGAGARAIKDSIIACKSFLDMGGLSLIIFPEGTRSMNGKIAKFKEGAAILAHELNLPMVPASVIGSRDVLPKGSYFMRPKRLAVRFGKPFKVSDWLSFDEQADRKAAFLAYREATSEIEKRVRALTLESEESL